MKRSNRLVILVGLLLAVLAFVGIVVVLNQNQATQDPGAEVTETVLVATRDIEIGEAVTADDVEPREVEPDAVVGTPLRDPSQLQGLPALVDIPADSQVSQERIAGGPGQAAISEQLEEGERAVAFVVDRVQGVEFLIQPGDAIDIVASINLLATDTDDVNSVIRSVKTVLQNKRVLYVSGSQAQPTTEPPAEGEGGAPAPVTAPTNVVIVIAGTDQDAEVLRFAQRTASEIGDQVSSALSVTLRRSGDATVEETTGITIEQLLNDYGLQIPDLTDIEELQPANEAEPEPEPAG